jgi:uncharacterized protein YfaS (alpha-2-macroglobulin family)
MRLLKSSRLVGAVVALLAVGVGVYLWAADKETPEQVRARANKLFADGNFNDAYKAIRPLALDGKGDPSKAPGDLTLAMNALQRLGRVDELDELREAAVTAHGRNWRLLRTAALSYVEREHQGYIVAGKFERGHRRGGTGRYVNAVQRDRVRAMQLMQQALPMMAAEKDLLAASEFYFDFARIVRHGTGSHQAWRLQYLTDLLKLPDYEDGHYYGRGRWGRRGWEPADERGAPVDDDDRPVYYKVPKTFDTAGNDGERWRWLLSMSVEMSPGRASEVDMIWADFCKTQFGVQTMAWAPKGGDGKAGTFSLHTLKDNETIARLATGLKRFTLPDEHNWIKIWERVITRKKDSHAERAGDLLASEYEDRRQYPRAAAAWRAAIAAFGKGAHNHRQDRLDQIVGNWGTFEPVNNQPAGTRATLELRFRNAKRATFEAHALKVEKLLDDIKAYLKTLPNPRGMFHNLTDVGDLGHRLVVQNQNQYLGERVDSWALDLKPRDNHVDDRITVKTPLDRPGAYLVTCKLDDGNTSRIIVWVSDTVIVQKMLDGKALYYVADAVTGKPVEKANLSFFGWRTVHVRDGNYRTEVDQFARNTDAEGMLTTDNSDQKQHWNWLITATKAGEGVSGSRFAFLGFQGIWYGGKHDPDYNATRAFTITDRPVYRPGNTVELKSWIRHSKYDQPDVSDFADKAFNVVIRNPKGEKVYEKRLGTDAYAGLNDSYTLPKDAALGVYSIQVGHHWATATFRVEEYKKPEFEVKVDSPKEPVRLGDKVDATVTAKYYFGAPVTQGNVKVKVLRTSHSTDWYPRARWDWFYGPGYWWFAADYKWYPGFDDWGCCRPIPVWWKWRPQEQPELVMEDEVAVGPDGTLKVTIDTTAAKELHPDTDHEYKITAEVTDQSRRTIVGTGSVIVSRKPFSVFTWVDRGHYRAGDTVKAGFQGLTPDRKPVVGKGEASLVSITYKDAMPVEKVVETWKVDTGEDGSARLQIKAARAGQYRLVYKLTDAKKNTIEGAYVFVVRGEGFDGKELRFNDLELVTDRQEYADGDKVQLMVNTNRQGAAVLLFARPAGVYLKPKLLSLKGKSIVEELAVTKKDMPNFFVEALTVHNGRVHTEIREIAVPPEKRVLNVEVLPNKEEYKPGEKATVKVKVTDYFGKPFEGSAVMTVYDRSVEYIAPPNTPEIKEFFWKWRRQHQPQTVDSVSRWQSNQLKPNERGMSWLGMFGHSVVEEMDDQKKNRSGKGGDPRGDDKAKDGGGFGGGGPPAPGAGKPGEGGAPGKEENGLGGGPGGEPPQAETTVRKNFADTAYWKANLVTNKDGIAEVTFDLPEQTTGWKIRVWGMGHGTKVGQGEAEVTTKKNILLRLQSPRFFTQKDEVVLSANVHNYLTKEKVATVSLETEGGTLALEGPAVKKVTIPPGGEARVDWRVKVKEEGPTIVRMKATTDEESDAMQMSFMSYVHGMLKLDSYTGVIRPAQKEGKVEFTIPKERRVPQTRLEVRYSPTLAGAMVDALPYLVDYPYGCTEQTLNRFLPTVITQRVLQRMKVDLADVQKKRVNLNAAEMGDPKERAKQWKRYDRNPVFDEAEVVRMVNAGVTRLTNMQCADGGWGWFSGLGERSYPHTTAVVVHGLQIAVANDIALVPGMLDKGVNWLKAYEQEQVRLIQRAPQKAWPYKEKADALDAFVRMVLQDAKVANAEMRDFLYRDRVDLPVYAKALLGLALHREGGQADKLKMVLQNIEQFVVEDAENQTAYLRLPAGSPWWHWYGSETEANAYYLKLLAAVSPKDTKAAGLVKYLLANRKHATYWNSTRDTAVCIEAMADYIKASGEDKPDMTLEVLLDGVVKKTVKIDAKNLFSFDNLLALEGEQVADGKHTVELRKKGEGPVYYNVYVTNFTLEDDIKRAGLEVKVNRKYYKLTRIEEKIKVRGGSRGQAADQRVEKYERKELKSLDTLKSGDLVEVELEIDSKNDYEYILFEDMKAAGFEPMEVRSGYVHRDGFPAYMELRDERVCFFVRALPRGKHSVSYRLRAEIPGQFSALPTKASAMYAPELKGNSDEIKLKIVD